MSKNKKKVWKHFLSAVLHNPLIEWPLVLIVAGIIWFVFLTSRHNFTNTKSLKNYRKKPVIFAFVHGRSLMLSPVIKSAKVKAYCIASQHKDGRMMARLQRLFGLRAIYGSTSKGALTVLREGVRTIKETNSSICISVDGPSGPSLQVKDGALFFARMTGAPIVPCCFSCSKPIYLNNWDKFMIPKLFGTISCAVGEPIYIDSKLQDQDFEKKRIEIEKIMIKQLRDLDSEFGLPETPYGINATEYKKNKQHRKEIS